MVDSDAEAFIEKFRSLLADRERAQKAIASLAIEKAELEQGKAILIEMNVKRENLLVETETKLKEATETMADLKDKERARSQVIDSLQTRLAAAEKREAMLEATLHSIGDQLDMAVSDTEEVEDAAQELEEIQKESIRMDEHETEHTPLLVEEPVRRRIPKLLPRFLSKEMPPSRIMRALIGSRCARIRTLAVAGSAPFLLMASLFTMASYGIYVSFFYDLMAPHWQPWMGAWPVEAAAFVVPIALLSGWYVLCGKGRRKANVPAEPETEPESETDEIGQKLDEIFDVDLDGVERAGGFKDEDSSKQ